MTKACKRITVKVTDQDGNVIVFADFEAHNLTLTREAGDLVPVDGFRTIEPTGFSTLTISGRCVHKGATV